MFHYVCLNPIAQVGLDVLEEGYQKVEAITDAQAALVRSASMHEMELPDSLEVVARAGAGVNNIPLEKCAEQGIVVFNTPGANANGVKELVLAGMFMASRDINGGINWVASEQDNPELAKLTEKQKKMQKALRWILITVGSLMMALSVYFFQTPNGITLGGVAGVAFLLEKATPISQGLWMAIINGALLFLGLIVLGKMCIVRTLYSSILYTGFIYILEIIGKETNIPHPVTGGNVFLALTYAILLFGIGGALIFNCGASSGGTDIIALIFKKFTKLNVGAALFIVDFIVICITLYSVDVETALYSFLGLFAKSFLLDSVIEGLGRTKYITIITTKPKEIGDYILNGVHHTYTVYEARGGYTGDEKKVILTICKRSEAWKLKTGVKQIDPNAFVIISTASEIVGKGFGGTI